MILFESTYSRDKELFKEIYFYQYYKSGVFLICEIILGISLLGNLLSLIFDSEPYYYTLGYIMFFLLVQFLGYHRMVKISMEREKEISTNGVVIYTISVFEDKITQKTTLGSEYTIDFSNIRRIYKTSNYIMLQSTAKQLFILKKNSFTVSDSETFITFLHEKGYKI